MLPLVTWAAAHLAGVLTHTGRAATAADASQRAMQRDNQTNNAHTSSSSIPPHMPERAWSDSGSAPLVLLPSQPPEHPVKLSLSLPGIHLALLSAPDPSQTAAPKHATKEYRTPAPDASQNATPKHSAQHGTKDSAFKAGLPATKAGSPVAKGGSTGAGGAHSATQTWDIPAGCAIVLCTALSATLHASDRAAAGSLALHDSSLTLCAYQRPDPSAPVTHLALHTPSPLLQLSDARLALAAAAPDTWQQDLRAVTLSVLTETNVGADLARLCGPAPSLSHALCAYRAAVTLPRAIATVCLPDLVAALAVLASAQQPCVPLDESTPAAHPHSTRAGVSTTVERASRRAAFQSAERTITLAHEQHAHNLGHAGSHAGSHAGGHSGRHTGGHARGHAGGHGPNGVSPTPEIAVYSLLEALRERVAAIRGAALSLDVASVEVLLMQRVCARTCARGCAAVVTVQVAEVKVQAGLASLVANEAQLLASLSLQTGAHLFFAVGSYHRLKARSYCVS